MEKQHKKTTLRRWPKKDLVEHCFFLENNNKALRDAFEIQYANCMKIVDDMKLLNKTLKEARRGET